MVHLEQRPNDGLGAWGVAAGARCPTNSAIGKEGEELTVTPGRSATAPTGGWSPRAAVPEDREQASRAPGPDNAPASDLLVAGRVLVSVRPPTPARRAAVAASLGAVELSPVSPVPPAGGPLGAQRRIEVRFVHALTPDTRSRGAGPNHRPPVLTARAARRQVRIQPAPAGGTLRLDAGPGRGPMPLLRSFVMLALLRDGSLPLHAAVVEAGGCRLALAGGSGAGKTTAQLALLRAGAGPVSSEWSVLDERGLVHLAHPIRLRPAHLLAWPRLATVVPLPQLARMSALAAAGAVVARFCRSLAWVARSPLAARLPALVTRTTQGAADLLDAAGSAAGRRASTDVPLDRLPGGREHRAGSPSGVGEPRQLEVLGILDAVRGPRLEASPLPIDAAVDRMTALMTEDLADILDSDIPGIDGRVDGGSDPAAELVRDWAARYRESLRSRLAGVRCLAVQLGPDPQGGALLDLLLDGRGVRA
jgi:hypothetical protein